MGPVFDGFDFLANGIIFTSIDHLRLAKRDNQFEKVANIIGGKLVQSDIGVKPIVLEGYYDGASAKAAQQMYDVLTQALNRTERDLIIPHAGGTRRYVVTPENIIIQQPDGLNRLTFSFEFTAGAGSSEDTAIIELFNTTITTATATIPFTVLGSVGARPVITVTYNSLTGGTSKTATIRNGRDYIGLTFARSFVAGDNFVIDSANYQLYINNVLTEPNGRFPSWSGGTGSLIYTDSLTTRNVSIRGTYQRKDL